MPAKRGKSTAKKGAESAGKKKIKVEVDYSMVHDIAHQLRIDSIDAISVTKSGHPTSCSSIADIMALLFFHESGLKFHWDNTKHSNNDRIVLSKGHAAPILYAAFYRSKIITKEQLMSLRLKDSIIEGHPVPKIPFVDVGTGSLGQGLSVAAGMAYSSKYFDKIDNRVFCILGDGECAEGSVWEAADFANYYKLNNLIAFLDVNALGQSQATMHAHGVTIFQKKFESFGWQAIVVDGHDFAELVAAVEKGRNQKNKPTIIVAKTLKGKYFLDEIEGKLNWHGKDLGVHNETVKQKLRDSMKHQESQLQFTVNIPEGEDPKLEKGTVKIQPTYELGSIISTRKAYGNALLKARESNPNVVGLDGDTKNSTFTITLTDKHPQSFVECFIAEQNMVGVATGLACRQKIPFCATFSCFLSRAADQIRIAGISKSTLKMVGSHSGCSIGEDGPSQMGLEDIAFFRTLPSGVVLVPSDGVSTEKAVQLIANYNQGPSFLRTGRPDVKVLYECSQKFQLGKLKTLKSSEEDKVVVIGCGVVVHEALKAYEQLATQGVPVRVIDLFSVKPLDEEGLKQQIKACKGRLVVVEDHFPEGGIYDAICGAAFEFIDKATHLCVRSTPGSAKSAEQLEKFGINAAAIVAACKNLAA